MPQTRRHFDGQGHSVLRLLRMVVAAKARFWVAQGLVVLSLLGSVLPCVCAKAAHENVAPPMSGMDHCHAVAPSAAQSTEQVDASGNCCCEGAGQHGKSAAYTVPAPDSPAPPTSFLPIVRVAAAELSVTSLLAHASTSPRGAGPPPILRI
jgi:hypothetical protein